MTAPTIPDVVREALEATFEQRDGYLTKVAAAVRAIGAPAIPLPAAPVQGWQPIETAPKDRRILLLRKRPYGVMVVGGHWQDDRFGKNIRPYWGHDLERAFGTIDARKNPPIAWMDEPLPPPPVGENE